MMTRVPDSITTHVQELGRVVSPNADLVYVDSQPVLGAQPNDCFPMVERQVSQEGGDVVYGWQIWEWPTLFFEAEFHAVWKLPSGELLDITPKDFPCSRILFIRDTFRTYEGKQVKNIFFPISGHPSVKEFLSLRDAEFEILNRGERAYQYSVKLSDSEAMHMKNIENQKVLLLQQLRSLSAPIGRNEPCPCGSGRKYGKCCQA